MADRRQPFSFRFWPTRRTPTPPKPAPTNSAAAESRPASRQSTVGTTKPTSTAETQIPSQPPTTTTTNSAPVTEPQSVTRQSTNGTTNPTSVTPPLQETTKTAPTTTPIAESQPVSRQSTATTTENNPPKPTSPTTTKQIDDQSTLDPKAPPPTEMQTAGHPTTTTLTSRSNEPKTSSPSTPIKSPSLSKPSSPSRRTTQSRSPPQPSSPAHVAPQARSITSSPPSRSSKTPSTTQRASQPHSPSHLTSPPPKQTSLNSPKDKHPFSPSKEKRQVAQETSTAFETQPLVSNEEDSKPAASQKEPQLKEEVKSKSSNDFNGDGGTSFKHNDVKEVPSKSSELGTIISTTPKLESSTPAKNIDASTELKSKPEGTKDVKEVVQATHIEAKEVKKEEVNAFPSQNSGEAQIVEKSAIPSKPDEKDIEKQDELVRKEILANSLPIAKPTKTISQPKRSTTPSAHDNSARTGTENLSLNKDIKDDISTFINQMAIGDPKNAIHDRKMSIITLAGENRGASMQMGSNSFKEGPVHIQRSYKVNPNESDETITDGDESFRGKQSEDAKVAEDQPTEAYVNNNAQGINNSIVFNASIAERDPGVHMVVNHAPKEPIRTIEKMSPLETRKAEFNMSHAEKLTYEPTVRRRCLRGLFMETSDSDPANPEKPRRHGCRVGCKLKEKEKDVDV